MFDLFRSRDKAVRWLLTGLLVLVALSMVTYLIPGSGGIPSAGEQVVAEIGKEQVTMRDVNTALQNMTRTRQITPDLYAVFAPQYINSLIQDRTLAYEAERLGFKVSDQELARAIQSIFPQLFPDGKFAGKDIYAQFLMQQNMSIEQFEFNLRKQILLTKLQNLALEGIIVTPDEVEKEYRKKNEKAKVDYIEFDQQKFRSQVNVSPEEVQKYFNEKRAGFTVSEKRGYDLILVDEEHIGPTINIADDVLRQAYQTAGERYRFPERVRVRHILLKTADRPKEDVPKMEAKAKDLLKQIRAGADFADLARKNSEDPGSATKGGDLDWVARGQTVQNFEKAAFSLKPKEISDVIRTEYGFHIIQVLEKEPARVKPFDEVKKALADELKKQMLNEKIQSTADQVRAELVKAPLSADSIARKYGLTVSPVENSGLGDPIPVVGASPDLQSALFSVQKGEVTSIIPSGPRLAVAVVKNITPSRPAQLNEVEAQIRQALIGNKAVALAKQKADEAAEKLKSSGDLKQVAKGYGLEVKSSPEFARDGAVEGLGAASYLSEAFTQPVGTVLKPASLGGRIFIVKVTGKSEADLGKLAAERDQMVQAIKSKKARERDELFRDGVLTRLVKEGKVKIHEDVIQRIVSSYAKG